MASVLLIYGFGITSPSIDGITGLPATIELLAAGASVTFNYTYTVTENDLGADVKNTARATADDPTSEDPEHPDKLEEEDSQETPTDDPNPKYTVVKETTNAKTGDEKFGLGETIEYRITVTNTGNVTLKNVVVTDELTGDVWTIESLAPKAQPVVFDAEHVVTEADIKAGSVVNVATAKADNPDDPEKPIEPDEPGKTEDPTEPEKPHLTVTKQTTSKPANGAAYGEGGPAGGWDG